jgi:putative component of membrane protein insertase Oxa1/YidC/SpoIIIJ protein YidD
MKKIALAMIIFYRRFVSPYKGFSCAYRIYTGESSCSAYGYRAIERQGIFIGAALIKRRFKRCSNAYRKHHGSRAVAYGLAQAGFCDIGCDVGICDAVDVGSCACDGLSSGCASPCDFGDWKRKKKDEDQYVEIGPESTLKSANASRNV